MRNFRALAAALAFGASSLHGFMGSVGELSNTLTFMPVLKKDYRQKLEAGMRNKGSGRTRTSGLYPHSGKRQQARYARQIAAGKLDFSASAGFSPKAVA